MRKILVSFFSISFVLALFIYGNYTINKNTEYLKNKVNEKIFVKIVSPNFDLKYGLEKKEIEDRFRKLIRYSDPDKNKKLYLFGQREFLVDIAMMRFQFLNR